MHTTSRLGAACAAIGLVLLSTTAAQADIVYDDLDATVDATHEAMSLQYDTADGIAGAAGATTLRIQIEGRPDDHPNCNLSGGDHFIQVAPAVDTTVASVALSDDGRFDSCDDTVTATVTPTGVGSTSVTFSEVDGLYNQGAQTRFLFEQAAFDVTVVEADLGSTGGGSTVCDEDPAAPAWATAILKGNGVKAKNIPNYVSSVAAEMGEGATFGGYDKNEHPSYEDEVWDYLSDLGLALQNGPAVVARPGWECTTG